MLKYAGIPVPAEILNIQDLQGGYSGSELFQGNI